MVTFCGVSFSFVGFSTVFQCSPEWHRWWSACEWENWSYFIIILCNFWIVLVICNWNGCCGCCGWSQRYSVNGIANVRYFIGILSCQKIGVPVPFQIVCFYSSFFLFVVVVTTIVNSADMGNHIISVQWFLQLFGLHLCSFL